MMGSQLAVDQPLLPVSSKKLPVGNRRREYRLGIRAARNFTGRALNPTAAIALYFAAIFIGGSLIAPWIWHLMQALAVPLPFLQELADEPFRRYVTRSWMIIGAAGLWPFLKAVGACSLKDIGLLPTPAFRREIGKGLAIGFGSLALIAILAVMCGARTVNLDHEAARWGKHLTNAILAALLVPIIEEVFFRGAVFGGLRRQHRLMTAALASSMLYAIVHFFERSIWEGPVTWSSGLVLLPRMLRGFGELQQLVPGFFSLTLAGMMLALAFRRTGALHFSMGLHAGWIFWGKSYSFMTSPVEGANAWFWGTGKLIDGWLAFGLLAAMTIGFLRWNANEPPVPKEKPNDAGSDH